MPLGVIAPHHPVAVEESSGVIAHATSGPPTPRMQAPSKVAMNEKLRMQGRNNGAEDRRRLHQRANGDFPNVRHRAAGSRALFCLLSAGKRDVDDRAGLLKQAGL